MAPERAAEFMKEFLRSPSGLCPPPAESLPKPGYMVRRALEADLRQLMLEADMAVLVPESMMPCDDLGRLILGGGGLWVYHKDGLYRIIYDRITKNVIERKLKWKVLPLGT